MNEEIKSYNDQQTETHQEICNLLTFTIKNELKEAESKIWHAHPVWFLDGNPVVGYSKQKKGIRLMFWSGADFDEESLIVREGKFKDASIFYNHFSEVNHKILADKVIDFFNTGKTVDLTSDFKTGMYTKDNI